jgi:hypothetical protein
MLSHSRALFGFIISMALTQLAAAAVTGYFVSFASCFSHKATLTFTSVCQICIDPSESGVRPSGFPKAVGVRLGTSAAVDIVIASFMTYFVRLLVPFLHFLAEILMKLLRDRSEFSMRTNAVITKSQYIYYS